MIFQNLKNTACNTFRRFRLFIIGIGQNSIRFSMLIPILLTLIIGQDWYNHPELDWQNFETKHFIVHFHSETERSAREAAVVAENYYDPITALYNFEPDSKTHLIIKDTDDYSNGAAYYYDNKIEIWARPLDFDLRGSHRWMQDVISHEFTHIIQIQASMKYSRKIPGFYLQSLGYETEKRDDVLYGYPNVIISYPIPGTAVPPWFAEGTAQFMYEGANFDYWDSHRDMILRDRVLNDKMLSFEEMNTFGKKGIGNESIYNQGFAFVKYLSSRFGPDCLRTISTEMTNKLNYSIRKAMKNATGIDGQELYIDWKNQLQSDYQKKIGHVAKNEVAGTMIISDGTANVHPVWSPDGQRFLFLSNMENDYFGQTDLFMYDLKDSLWVKLMAGVQTAPCWVNDSTIIYARKNEPNFHGSRYFDLFKFNISTEEEIRLTTDLRLISPVVNHDSKMLAAITTFDGTANVLISELDSIDFHPLTDEHNGIQMFSLDWAGQDILVDAVTQHGRSIYSIGPDGRMKLINAGVHDERDPVRISTDIVWSSDASGVYNLRMTENGLTSTITNVTGGAFMPDISRDGKIVYSQYKNGRFNISIINSPRPVDVRQVGYSPDYAEGFPNSDWINYGDQSMAEPYTDMLDTPFIMPRLMWDYKTLKPGFYAFASDVLNKVFIFGGASLNRLGDKDIFLLFEYAKMIPTFYFNFFWISRNTVQKTNIYEENPTTSDLAIQLFATDIGARFPLSRHKFWIYYSYNKYREVINQVVQNTTGQLVAQGKIGFDDYRGHSLNSRWQFSTRKPEFAGNMLPSNGWEADAKISYEWNAFMYGFGFNEEDSTIEPQFIPNDTYRLDVDFQKHVTLVQARKIVGTLETKIGYVSNKSIDDFFYFFGGGLPGIKGYTFYDDGLNGPYLWINTAVVRIPVFLEKSYPVLHLNIQNMSCGIIFQAGGGFSGRLTDYVKNEHYKLSTGIEVRTSGFSFFGYPTAIGYEYHVPVSDASEKKGKQYVMVLFDF